MSGPISFITGLCTSTALQGGFKHRTTSVTSGARRKTMVSERHLRIAVSFSFRGAFEPICVYEIHNQFNVNLFQLLPCSEHPPCRSIQSSPRSTVCPATCNTMTMTRAHGRLTPRKCRAETPLSPDGTTEDFSSDSY